MALDNCSGLGLLPKLLVDLLNNLIDYWPLTLFSVYVFLCET